MTRLRDEPGAAAVEFALILPLLIVLLFGIFEFGRLFNEQITVSNAAREAARVMAIADDAGKARAAAVASSEPSLDPDLTDGQIVFSVDSCRDNPGKPVVATIKYESDVLFPGFWDFVTGSSLTLTGSGQMVCGG